MVKPPGAALDRGHVRLPSSVELRAGLALADSPADSASSRAALAICALSLGMFLALVPFAKMPLPAASWFIPLNQSVLIINDIMTATLLLGQWRLSRHRAVLVLACGYLYSAGMAVAHLLTFPGVFTSTGLLGAGTQSTAYVFIFWHAGFPLFVMAYALLKARPAATLGSSRVEVGRAIALTAAVAVCLSALAIVGNDVLPAVLQGIHYSSSFDVVRIGVWLVTAGALGTVWRQRGRSVLDLWLVVVLAAWFFEVGLVAIFNAGRYDVGFYAGRAYALAASSVVMVMLLTEQGRLYRALARASDIARSEAALRETRDVLSLAMQGGRMGAWSRDLVQRSAWWSPELERILGLAEGSLRAHPGALTERIHPEDRSRVRRLVVDAIAAHEDIAVEFRVRHADGTWVWIDGRGAVSIDEAGRPAKLFGILIDISSRKRGEAAAAEMEIRFRNMADGITQLAWVARPDGWIEWYNRRWYEYTGTTPAEMEGWGWQRVHDPAALPEVLERWQQSIATGEPFEMVFPLRGADGRFRPFLTRVSPARDATGRVLQWFGTNTDITDQRLAEQALLDADRRKDEFLATLAHELRNPLAPIRNVADLLGRMEPLPETAKPLVQMLGRQSQHLVQIVDDLLDVSRITQGKVQLRRREISLIQCLSEAVEAVQSSMPEASGLRFDVDLGSDPLYADVDETRISQSFVNMLHNAIKFTPAPGVVLVDAKREEGMARISFTDSGIGIDSGRLSDVFDMFSQADNALSREQGGLGVGLALVKGFVELHGGTVEAQSSGAGRGSTFTVRLPLSERPAVAPAQPQAAQLSTRCKVLVVDDNVDAATSLRALLEMCGYEVLDANDGSEGLRQAREFEPDVVLLDLGMPGMNGLEVARELRRTAVGARLLLIAVTGWGQPHDRELTRQAGFDHHLTKPLTLEDLEALLRGRGDSPRSELLH